MKKILLLPLAIVLIITVLIIVNSNNSSVSESIELKYKKCTDIEEKIKNNETFALFILNNTSNQEESEEIHRYLNTYKNENIYRINKIDISKDCIKNIIISTGLYDIIEESQNNSILCYKNGKLTASQHNLFSYDALELFLDENDIIKKRIIKEEINFKRYKENKQKSKYILLIFSNEEQREMFSNNMKNVFKEYEYNIINRKTDVGKLITENIEKEYKKINEYPRILYFENNELIKDDSVFGIETFKHFKTTISS